VSACVCVCVCVHVHDQVNNTLLGHLSEGFLNED